MEVLESGSDFHPLLLLLVHSFFLLCYFWFLASVEYLRWKPLGELSPLRLWGASDLEEDGGSIVMAF